MLEVTFSCPFCSRMFLEDCPFDGPLPRHLDPLLGVPCPGSGAPSPGFLEIPEHPHEWPRFPDDLKVRRSR